MRLFLNSLMVSIFILCKSVSADTHHAGKLSLGLLSPQGLMGINYEYIIPVTRAFSFAPTLGFATDPVGPLKTVGLRGFKNFSLDHSKWYNRCFFLFKNCHRFWTFSGYAHHTEGGDVTVKKSNTDLEYSTSEGWMSSLSLGTRLVINKLWLFDIEVSKRLLLSGMEVVQKEGPVDSSERQDIEDFRNALGISFGFGLIF